MHVVSRSSPFKFWTGLRRARASVRFLDRHSHFWSYAHNFRTTEAALATMLSDRIEEGFREDKFFIEAQQKIVEESAGDTMAFILADKGLAMGRRMIEQHLATEQAAGSARC